MQQLKAYLLEINFEETAQIIADAVNGATPDCSKEKAELASVNSKITNGVKAVLSGMENPELQDEIDRLRIRKDELGDIISHMERGGRKKVDPNKIVGTFKYAAENWDDKRLKQIIQSLVTKMYASPDGSFTVNVGVHTDGTGGRT